MAQAKQSTVMHEVFEMTPELELVCLVNALGWLARLGTSLKMDLFYCLNKTNSSLLFLR